MKWIRSRSIKTKLLAGFSAIVLLMFGTLFALNHLFLDDYFLYVNERNMIRTTRIGMEQGDDIDYRKVMDHVTKGTGGQVLVYDADLEITHGAVPGDRTNPSEDERLHQLVVEADEHISDGVFKVVEWRGDNEQQIVYMRKLPDDDYLMVIKGFGLVNEARLMFVIFLGMASVVVYLAGFALIYWYARQFTKPIIRLKSAAERIADLDFDERLTIHSDDEVGQLMRSVNSMALALSVSIEELNISNSLLERELSKERNLEKMRRRFMTDVSHELKNPISMIIGYADGILRGLTKNDEDRSYYAGVIKEEGLRMNRLVCDLLDISSYVSGTFNMKKETMDLSELLQGCLNRYQAISHEKAISVLCVGEKQAMVYGDRIRLEQVMVNLLDNAFKHVNEGGIIKADIRQLNNKTVLTLSNTGDLIPEDELENIWESFYQVDTDAEGNGLGLTIVRSIIELHGGSVSVYIDDIMNHFELTL